MNFVTAHSPFQVSNSLLTLDRNPLQVWLSTFAELCLKNIRGFAATIPTEVMELIQTTGAKYGVFVEEDKEVFAVNEAAR